MPTEKTTRAGRRPDAGSRQAILEAAAQMMAERGYSGTSISMICKAAGCPASSLYWHFSSKENLFAEVVKWKADHFFNLFGSDKNLRPGPSANVDDVAELVGRGLEDDPAFLRFLILLGLERQDMPSEARKVIEDIRISAFEWWRALLEAYFVRLGPSKAREIADEYAAFGRSLIDGAFFAWDFGDGPDLRKVFRQLMVLLSALNDTLAKEKPGP